MVVVVVVVAVVVAVGIAVVVAVVEHILITNVRIAGQSSFPMPSTFHRLPQYYVSEDYSFVGPYKS